MVILSRVRVRVIQSNQSSFETIQTHPQTFKFMRMGGESLNKTVAHLKFLWDVVKNENLDEETIHYVCII
jgi:hypothetical protein